MSKMLQDKKQALEKIKYLDEEIIKLSNNLACNVHHIVNDLVPKLDINNLDNNLTCEIADIFRTCINEVNALNNTEEYKQDIEWDINDGFYDNNKFITRHCINVKRINSKLETGFETLFRDDNRHWYYAKLIKKTDMNDININVRPYIERIYTLTEYTSIMFANKNNIKECICDEDDIYDTEFNETELINFIENFIDHTFDITPENAYEK